MKSLNLAHIIILYIFRYVCLLYTRIAFLKFFLSKYFTCGVTSKFGVCIIRKITIINQIFSNAILQC